MTCCKPLFLSEIHPWSNWSELRDDKKSFTSTTTWAWRKPSARLVYIERKPLGRTTFCPGSFPQSDLALFFSLVVLLTYVENVFYCFSYLSNYSFNCFQLLQLLEFVLINENRNPSSLFVNYDTDLDISDVHHFPQKNSSSTTNTSLKRILHPP